MNSPYAPTPIGVSEAVWAAAFALAISQGATPEESTRRAAAAVFAHAEEIQRWRSRRGTPR